MFLSKFDIRALEIVKLIPIIVRAPQNHETVADASIVSVVAIRTRCSVGNAEDEAAVTSGCGVDGNVGRDDQVLEAKIGG